MIEAFKAVKAYQDEQSLSQNDPVAEVVSKFGDPESFGEREIRVLADLQKIAYGTKLFCTPSPGPQRLGHNIKGRLGTNLPSDWRSWGNTPVYDARQA